jgi:hypothetical protein
MDDTTTHQQNKDEVFGKDAPRDATGQPLERGIGSKWAAMHPADKTLFHAAETRDLAETLLAQTKTLHDTATKFLEAHKAMVHAAGDSAKAVPPKPAVVEEIVVEKPAPKPLFGGGQPLQA